MSRFTSRPKVIWSFIIFPVRLLTSTCNCCERFIETPSCLLGSLPIIHTDTSDSLFTGLNSPIKGSLQPTQTQLIKNIRIHKNKTIKHEDQSREKFSRWVKSQGIKLCLMMGFKDGQCRSQSDTQDDLCWEDSTLTYVFQLGDELQHVLLNCIWLKSYSTL